MVLETNITSVIPSENDVREVSKKKNEDQKGEEEEKQNTSRKLRSGNEDKRQDDIKVIGDDLVIKRFRLHECIIYCIFVAIFIVMVILGRTYGEFSFYVGDSIADALEGDRTTKYFNEVSNIEDFWVYTIEEFIPNILVEEFDNGEEITDPHKRYFVAGTNLLMGGFRIGQKRVAPEKCKVPKDLEKSFEWCYPPYYWWKSARAPIVIDNTTNFTVYWQTSSETQDSNWLGRMSSYDGNGYVVDFRRNLTEALDWAEKMRAARFVDEQTRAIFFDFNTYNPIYNLDTVSRLVFEFPATGGIWPYFEIKSWQFRCYYGPRGTKLLVFELLFWVGVVWYFFEEICEVLSPSGRNCFEPFNKFATVRDYWQSAWNRLDILNLVFFFMYGVTRLVIWSYILEYISWNSYEHKFYSLRYLQRIAQICTWILMMNGFLLFIKLFKYFGFAPRLLFIVAIIQKSWMDVLIFLIAFIIIMLGFALMGYIAFCSDVYAFRSFSTAFANLLQYVVADMDLDELMKSNKYIGNIYYIMWSLLMIMVLSNVFIAILCNAYSEVQDELKNSLVKIEIPGLEMFSKLGLNFNVFNANKDDIVDKEELGAIFGNETAKELMEKYGGDDGVLDKQEFKRMKTDLLVGRKK